MPPSRLIIDINRCFEPSPFNTGPAIPSLLLEDLSNTAANAPSTHPQSCGTYLPELTSSPASSIGSSLQSLSLEDEEIKRIFAPGTEGSRYDVYHSPNGFYTPIHEETVNYFTSKEYLNPYAAPFIPSFTRSPSVVTLAPIDPAFQPSPLDLGFEPINFKPLTLPTPQNQDSFPPQSPHPNCIPLPPGSGRYFGLEEQEHSTTSLTATQHPPIYLPLLIEAFQPETPDRVRKVLAHAIVNSSPQWDLEALYDLGRRITEEARKPGADRQEIGFGVFPCDSARYRLDTQTEEIQEESSFKREIAVADMSLHLYNHFRESRNPVHGEEFWWNLRESVLSKFIETWDSHNSTNPGTAINFKNRPTIDAVRSALALCRSVGALFSRNLIESKHISMCISILFKHLMSVEHVEGLANLILASGPTLWKPTSEDTVTEVEVRADTRDSPVTDGSLSESATPPVKRVFENSHVNDFLNGLVGNVIVRGLKGEESVVNMGWAQGRFKARIIEIHDAVKNWERMMMDSLTQPLVPPGLLLKTSS